MVNNSSLHCSKIRQQVKWPRNLNAALFSHNGILLTEYMFNKLKSRNIQHTSIEITQAHFVIWERGYALAGFNHLIEYKAKWTTRT